MIFFGSGHFGEVVLKELISLGRTPTRVVSETTDLATLHSYLTPTPDVVLVASFGMIVPPELLAMPMHGFINIHPSLLPKYRGPSPLQATILNGDTETGVTLMVMDEEMDHGPIIGNFQYPRPTSHGRSPGGRAISNSQTIYKPQLEQVLATLGAKLYHEKIDDYISGKLTPVAQDHTKATYTKIVHRNDGHIDWLASAETIDRMRRAYEPWPGIWTMFNGKRLKILDATPLNGAPQMTPGTVLVHGADGIAIVCGEQSMYRILNVQLEGKRSLQIQEFLRGQKGFIGSALR